MQNKQGNSENKGRQQKIHWQANLQRVRRLPQTAQRDKITIKALAACFLQPISHTF